MWITIKYFIFNECKKLIYISSVFHSKFTYLHNRVAGTKKSPTACLITETKPLSTARDTYYTMGEIRSSPKYFGYLCNFINLKFPN